MLIKWQFGFQKPRLEEMVKNRCKVNLLATLSNLFMACSGLPMQCILERQINPNKDKVTQNKYILSLDVMEK